jgi:RHS repeat-associated protein
MGGDSYRYDRLGRVTVAAVTMPGGEAWSDGTSYDAFGNIEVQSATGPQSSSMMMIPVDSWSNRIDGAEYDWSGNLTAMTYGMESTTWDALGRVAGYSPVSARDQSYGYDASGERVVSYGVSPQGDPELRAVYTVHDLLGRPIREYRSSPTGELEWSRDHVFLGRNAIASEASTTWPTGGQILHHHRDHLGSLRLITDPDGLVVVEQAFEPFGAAWAQSEEPLQFTGHEREPGFGWDYMHARYYTPEWGRFWSVDPIGGTPAMPQSWNAYAYVMGDPVNLFDPWGMECTQSSDGQIRCDGGEITVTAEYEVTTIPIPYWGPIKIPGRGGGGEGGGGTNPGQTYPVLAELGRQLAWNRCDQENWCGQEYIDCLGLCVEAGDPLNSLENSRLALAPGFHLPKALVGHKFLGRWSYVPRMIIPEGANHFTNILSSISLRYRLGAGSWVRGLGSGFASANIGYGVSMFSIELYCASECNRDVCSFTY